MPTDAGSRPVLVDPGLPEFIHLTASELRCLSAQFVEKRRQLTRCFHATPAVIVPQPKTDHSTISEMTMELERLQIQCLQASHKCGLRSFGNHVLLVAKAWRR